MNAEIITPGAVEVELGQFRLIPGPKGEPGERGPRGYGIASAVLNRDYTLTLRFENGDTCTTPSIRGEQGRGLQILGHADSPEELYALAPDPAPGCAYSVGTRFPHDIYVFVETSHGPDWVDIGPVQGPDEGVTSFNGQTGDVLFPVDPAPAEGSRNPVTGGGVWEGLRRKPNPNLLDNWYFVNPVNQRRLAECTAEGYTIDRWSCNCYEDYPLTIRENGVLLRGNRGFFQRIEPYKIEETETYTYSLLFADGSLKSVSFKFPDTRVREIHPIDGSGWAVAADGKGDGRYYQTAFYKSNGNTDAVVSAAKLELGDQQTLAHREGDRWVLNEIPDYGTELLKCQRYYQIFATEDRRPVEAEDFRPVMRVKPALGTVEINGRTCYTADANL